MGSILRGHRTRWLGWFVVLSLGLGLSWLLRSVESPRSIESVEPRVILFAPNLNEAAWVLGQGSEIVAITDFCTWPTSLLDRPRVGGLIDPNLERIAALAPSLLVLQGENPTLRSFAAREGLRVADVRMDTDLQSIFEGIERLAVILGRPHRGPAVTDSLRHRLDQIRATVPGGPHPTVLLILNRQPGSLEGLLAVGPGTYLHDLLRIAGGSPYPDGEGPPYRNLSLEALLARPPQIAIDLLPGVDEAEIDRDQLRAPWLRLGLRDTRVTAVTFDGVLVPGPRVDQIATALAAAIRPGDER